MSLGRGGGQVPSDTDASDLLEAVLKQMDGIILGKFEFIDTNTRIEVNSAAVYGRTANSLFSAGKRSK